MIPITFNNDFTKATKFVELCQRYKSQIDLYVNSHYIIDAKSMLGVYAFAGGYDLEVCFIISGDAMDEYESFLKNIKEFRK